MNAPEKFLDDDVKARLYAKLDRMAREFAALDAERPADQRASEWTARIGWASWSRDLVVPVVRREDGAIDVEGLACDVRAALDAVYAGL
jgi:hypothetical protein